MGELNRFQPPVRRYWYFAEHWCCNLCNTKSRAWKDQIVELVSMFQFIDKCYSLLPTQILGTGFLIILLNLGIRQQGDVRYVFWSYWVVDSENLAIHLEKIILTNIVLFLELNCLATTCSLFSFLQMQTPLQYWTEAQCFVSCATVVSNNAVL